MWTREVQDKSRYLVELTPSETGFDDIRALTDRARAAAKQLSREGRQVRFLRSLFVPEDGTCYLLFEGSSTQAVREAGRLAALQLASVSETLSLPDRDGTPSGEEVEPDGR
jgi:hypothetical protein